MAQKSPFRLEIVNDNDDNDNGDNGGRQGVFS